MYCRPVASNILAKLNNGNFQLTLTPQDWTKFIMCRKKFASFATIALQSGYNNCKVMSKKPNQRMIGVSERELSRTDLKRHSFT